jgi:hypothetical protein
MIIIIFVFLIGFVIGSFFGSTSQKNVPLDAAPTQTKRRTINSVKSCTHIAETNSYIWILKDKYERPTSE